MLCYGGGDGGGDDGDGGDGGDGGDDGGGGGSDYQETHIHTHTCSTHTSRLPSLTHSLTNSHLLLTTQTRPITTTTEPPPTNFTAITPSLKSLKIDKNVKKQRHYWVL